MTTVVPGMVVGCDGATTLYEKLSLPVGLCVAAGGSTFSAPAPLPHRSVIDVRDTGLFGQSWFIYLFGMTPTRERAKKKRMRGIRKKGKKGTIAHSHSRSSSRHSWARQGSAK